MMKLSTMWSVEQTYDTLGQSGIAERIASRWRYDPGSVRSFRASANFVNVLTRDDRRAFLRFAAESERSAVGIQQELELLAWLDREGVPVVQPLPSRSGSLVETVVTPVGAFHAVLFDSLDGRCLESDALDSEGYRTWGATVGRLHAAFARLPSTWLAGAPSWRVTLDLVERQSTRFPTVIQREAGRLRSVLNELPRDSARYGLIHRDLELDNLIWDGTRFAILDFDEFSPGWFLFDLAKALSDPLDAGLAIDSPKLGAFVAGYREHHPLADVELGRLPEFASLESLMSYVALDRAIDIRAEDAPAAWLGDLIVRLDAWMRRYEASIV